MKQLIVAAEIDEIPLGIAAFDKHVQALITAITDDVNVVRAEIMVDNAPVLNYRRVVTTIDTTLGGTDEAPIVP